MDGLGIVGRVLLNGISGVEQDGWISPLLSPLQSIYRLDVVDNSGLIFFSFVFFCPCFNIGWCTVGRMG